MSRGFREMLTDKKTFYGLLVVIVLSCMVLLSVDIFSQTRDGRRQIVDNDGGQEQAVDGKSLKTEEELRLQAILSQVAGVGDNQVMITYQEEQETVSVFSSEKPERKKIKGVIVAAQGASNTAVKLSIIDAVTSVYGIPTSSVMVFQLEE